jgi:hypothetical protein
MEYYTHSLWTAVRSRPASNSKSVTIWISISIWICMQVRSIVFLFQPWGSWRTKELRLDLMWYTEYVDPSLLWTWIQYPMSQRMACNHRAFRNQDRQPVAGKNSKLQRQDFHPCLTTRGWKSTGALLPSFFSPLVHGRGTPTSCSRPFPRPRKCS